MNKKVLLIYPPSEQMNRTARCQQPIKELIVLPPLPPTDLMYCASIARKFKSICKIRDYSVEKADLLSDLKDFEPDTVLINVASTTFENDMLALDTIKKYNDKILTIATGAHFLTFNKSVLEEYKNLDIIIRGEPEITFGEIVSGKNLSEIDGITYRKGEKIISNNNRDFLENLDELPFPSRDLIDNNLYVRPDSGKKQAIIRVSQGCPFHCFFCLATPVSGERVRYRSVDNIIDEIKECIKKYEIKNFVFWSDLFTANHDFIKEFCQKIISEKLDIVWGSNSRVDTINEEILILMKKAGCNLMSFGIESGSQEILDKIGKKITKENAENAVRLCKKHKIKVFAYFVIGLPWENKNNILDTINFAIKLNPDYVNFYTAAALPGSRFYDYILQNEPEKLKDKDFYKSPYYYPCVGTKYLTKEEIKNLHKTAVKKFYLRPQYIIKKITEMRTFTQFVNYFKAGFSVLLKK